MFEVVESRRPECAESVEPSVEVRQRRGIERINPRLGHPALCHQSGAAKYSEVPGNGRSGHGKSSCDLTDRKFTEAQEIKDFSPNWVRNGAKGTKIRWNWLSNHVVT